MSWIALGRDDSGGCNCSCGCEKRVEGSEEVEGVVVEGDEESVEAGIDDAAEVKGGGGGWAKHCGG